MILKNSLGTLCLLLLLAGCNHGLTENLSTSEYGELKKNNAVKMTVAQNKYTSNQKEISFKILNNSDSSITFGAPYQLETYVNDAWYKIPFKNNQDWMMIGIVLQPNESYEQRLINLILNCLLVNIEL
ncbi:immunoglobulin-like domain-containing protein [Gracilibacillus salinarum]|uniref:Bacterial Ig-like domain-containing protein n=1 Tax=Gracilibacillus salinarum TaxID=2932255 RepID=A0ABY4GJ80_9BACI|nr:immunoglobulin-like domain-containing protein [Gracilibacillus salinarum]UOQ84418.1 hypothetical protein MUN87_17235 [Gracilibacillus salinarum]